MSQSDYLKHKKIATELKVDHQTHHPAVFDAKQYIEYRSYAVTKGITNTKTTYNKVVPSTVQVLFDVEEIVTDCPSFECTSTGGRPNRIPHTGRICDVHPLNWRQINNKDVYEMNRRMNKTNYDENNCCPTSAS